MSPSEPGRGEGDRRSAVVEECAEKTKPFVDALLAEMERRHAEQPHPIRTVYFGGGTPSILPVSQLSRIVEGLRRWFDLSQVEEVTLECNPEDLTADYLQDLKALDFVNRLSIGIQSLDDDMLRLLGRRHTARQALDAVERAHAAGFTNLSADFMYGLPGVNFPLSTFHFPLSHISLYALTIEPGTALAVQVGQGRVVLPDDDEVARQYHALHDQLSAAGYRQYEVSNYALPGCESIHNSRYWDRTPYLGLGPGAHSFTAPADPTVSGGTRRWNLSDLSAYTSHTSNTSDTSYFQQETLTPADAFNELLMTRLRTTRGLSQSDVPEEQRERLHRLMQPFIDCGWIEGEYRPTVEGLLHADGMAAALFV